MRDRTQFSHSHAARHNDTQSTVCDDGASSWRGQESEDIRCLTDLPEAGSASSTDHVKVILAALLNL